MADFDSQLPVRSEADGDGRVQTKLVDSTNPGSQQGEIDSDNNLHVEVNGDDPGGTERILRLSEQGHASIDGIHDGTNNSDPSNIGLIAHSRAASPSDTEQTERLTSVIDSGGTIRALDIALHDESGNAYSSSNPLPVTISNTEGTLVHDYQTTASVAGGSSVQHDYTVSSSTTLSVEQVWATGSGKIKLELQVEDSVGAGTYTTQAVGFNSTADPNINFALERPIEVSADVNVRVQLTNRDRQAQDLYSTLVGVER